MAVIIETSDASSELDTAYEIAAGDRFIGSIFEDGDVDIISTPNLTGGEGFFFVLEREGGADAIDFNRIFLLNENGEEVDRSGSGNSSTSIVSVSPSQDASFFASVDPSGSETGSYALSLIEEVSNSLATNSGIMVGETLTSAVDYDGDVDIYSLSLENGNGYYFVLEREGTSQAIDFNRIFLLNENGEEVDRSGSGNSSTSIVSVSPSQDASFFASVDPSGSETGSYALSLIEEVSNSLATNSGIMVGETLTSAVDYDGDVDVFSLSLEGGNGYYFVLEGGGGAAGIQFNRIFLLEEDGEEVDRSDSGDNSTSIVSVSPAEDGAFFASVNPAGGQTGTYDLSLIEEVSNSLSTNSVITPNDTLTGAIDYSGDVDVFAANLEAGSGYIFLARNPAAETSVGTNRVFMLDENGDEVSRSSNGDLAEAGVVVDPTSDGVYYISANPAGSQSGAYELELVEEVASGFNTLSALDVGAALISNLDYNTDLDTYRVTLDGGTDYRFSLASDSAETGVDSVSFRLFDPAGIEVLVAGSDVASLERTFSIPETGTYFLSVGANNGFDSGTYEVLVESTGATAEADALEGTGEADTIAGLGGDDTVQGGDGNDILTGDGGNDVISGQNDDDTVSGGEGNDLLAGAAGNDSVLGDGGNDNMGGGPGNDTMEGGAGRDFMGGGQDDDLMDGGADGDVVNGGPGNDTLRGGDGDDTMGGSFGNDSIEGGTGNDDMGGGAGSDTISGGDGDDSAGGGEGNDVIDGGAGDDFLAGGGRDDSIDGGDGIDRINAGDGDDTMTGGAGADLFIFNGFRDGDADVITDFEDGVDRLRLTGVAGQNSAERVAALNIEDTEFGAQISYQGHTILLTGVTAAELGTEDFVFI